jgi:hypothetical protein
MQETTTASQGETNSDESKKTPRIRSVAYPSSTIKNCVAFVEKIDKEFTSVAYTPKESISKNIGMSGGSFFMLLSSCVQYDLLELKQNLGYKPTAQFKKIQKPLPTETVQDFYLECLGHPPLYKKLIAEFKDKQLPTESGLSNILDRIYEVKGNAASIAAKVFLKNLSALDLVREGNILKIDFYTPFTVENEVGELGIEKPNSTIILSQVLSTPKKKEELQKKEEGVNNFKEIPVFYKNGTEGKVVLPINFTDDDLRRVINVMNGYLS